MTDAADTPKRYLVRTFGCQMNEHDSERIAGLLDADGMEAVDSDADADVVVLNTCCIRENADNRLYGNLGHLKRWKEAKEGRQIVVSGCLAQKDRELVRQKAPWTDVVLGTHNVHRAGELLQHAGAHGPITEILDEAVIDDHALFPSALPARRETSYNAWVTIQIGCDNSCAFCIVPAVRGAEISRPFDDVVAEVHDLAAQGVTEITLLGQNVNSYGRDLQLAARRDGDGEAKLRPLFADLITATAAVPGIRRVRFTSPHPKDMRPETFAAMAGSPQVCEHLHYPLQSGSDRVLSLMVADGRVSVDDARQAKRENVPRLRKPMPLLAPHSTDQSLAIMKETPIIQLTLDSTIQAALEQLARKLYDTVAAPLSLGALRLSVRPSIGIAMCPSDADTAAALLQCADAAMYRAKRLQLGHAFFEAQADTPARLKAQPPGAAAP